MGAFCCLDTALVVACDHHQNESGGRQYMRVVSICFNRAMGERYGGSGIILAEGALIADQTLLVPPGQVGERRRIVRVELDSFMQ